MELLIVIDALKRASAARITAVMPYFGYSRQDRKLKPRVPITAKLVADLLTSAGANRVLTMELHAGQIMGFFNIPVDNLLPLPVFVRHIHELFQGQDIVIVSPDMGGVVRARSLAQKIGAQLAVIDKRRERPGMSEVMNVIGDVDGKICIILDDIVDSAGTLCNAALAVRNKGAKDVFAYVTHAVLSGEAVQRVEDSVLRKLIVTDSICPVDSVRKNTEKIEVLSIAGLISQAIRNISEETSISVLFM